MQLYMLMLTHLLYDFHLQNDFIAKMKCKNLFILGVHALTWAMLIGCVLLYFGTFAIDKVFFLFVTHFVIDWWKCRTNGSLYIDQLLHLLTLMVV